MLFCMCLLFVCFVLGLGDLFVSQEDVSLCFLQAWKIHIHGIDGIKLTITSLIPIK